MYPRYVYPRDFRERIQRLGRAEAPPEETGRGLPFSQVMRAALTHWDLYVSPELHARFGIDLEDPSMSSRTWGWLVARLWWLAADPTSTLHSLAGGSDDRRRSRRPDSR